MKPTNQTPLDEATRQISALLGERLGSTLADLFALMGIAEDEISAAMVRHRVHACLLHATMSCFRVDDSAPVIVASAAAPHTRPASIRPASPALPRYRLTDSRESLIDTALLWHEFALSLRARFDVEQKALDAIVFTVAAGGTSLSIPFKRLPTVSTTAAATRLSSRSSRPRCRRMMNSGVWSGSCTKTSSSTSSSASNEKTRGPMEARTSLRVFANRDVSFQRRSEIDEGSTSTDTAPENRFCFTYVSPIFFKCK